MEFFLSNFSAIYIGLYVKKFSEANFLGCFEAPSEIKIILFWCLNYRKYGMWCVCKTILVKI